MGRKGSKVRWCRERSNVKIRNRISKEKVAIHSYLCGDGYIKHRKKFHYDICLFMDHYFLAKRIVNLFKKEFNITLKIKGIKSDVQKGFGYYWIRASNKPVCLNLLSLGKYDSLNWAILRYLNKNLTKEWIRCFFDCEAHVNKYNKQIQVKSVNRRGLKQIKERLISFGINCKVYGPYKNGENHNDYFMLTIYHPLDISKYKRIIGFYHPDKLRDLRRF